MTGQNTSSAVMQQRQEARDSLDDFPTPPWATRALLEIIRRDYPFGPLASAWEPACNRGQLAEVLREEFGQVIATDIHDYGYAGMDAQEDFLLDWAGPPRKADWIITNPPFRLGADFIHRALSVARVGVAMFLRTSFCEGQERYETLFRDTPEALFLPFTERVVLWKGVLLDPDIPIRVKRRDQWVVEKPTTATSYAWFVFTHGHRGRGAIERIPPCRKRLTRAGDYPPAPEHLRPRAGDVGFLEGVA